MSTLVSGQQMCILTLLIYSVAGLSADGVTSPLSSLSCPREVRSDVASMLQASVQVHSERDSGAAFESDDHADAALIYRTELMRLVEVSQAALSHLSAAELGALGTELSKIRKRVHTAEEAAGGLGSERNSWVHGKEQVAERSCMAQEAKFFPDMAMHAATTLGQPTSLLIPPAQRYSFLDPANPFTSISTAYNEIGQLKLEKSSLERSMCRTSGYQRSHAGALNRSASDPTIGLAPEMGASEVDSRGGPPPVNDTVTDPPKPTPRYMLAVCGILVALAFVLIVYLLLQHSPLRGGTLEYDAKLGRYVYGSELSHRRIVQVCLPYWIPVKQDTTGRSFLVYFAALTASAVSLGFLYAEMMLVIMYFCDKHIFDSFTGPSRFSFDSYLNLRWTIVCICGVLVSPIVYLFGRKELKGREVQWLILGWKLFLLFMGSFTAFMTSYISAGKQNYFYQKSADEYWHFMRTFFAVNFGLGLFINVASIYTDTILEIRWRRFMTKYVVEKYFDKRAYYVLNSNSGKEDGQDNPDARIENDIANSISAVMGFLFGMLGLITSLVTQMMIVWVVIPYWTVYAVFYTVLGSAVALYFAWQFMRLNYEIERKSADFRFSLVNVRTQAEAIAFYGGERTEKADIMHKFEQILEFNVRSVYWSVYNGLWRFVYQEGLTFGPEIILAQRYFRGHLDFGGHGQTLGAFGGLTGSLSFLQNSSGAMASVGTSLTRLGGLLQRMDDITSDPDIKTSMSKEPVVELRDVSVRTPDGSRLLIYGLNLSVGGAASLGKRLLIVGRSGTGKSSLIRSIAGLWTQGGGEVVRPNNQECMFLPQKPYMPIGNLRAQLRYPDVGPTWDPWVWGEHMPTKESEWYQKNYISKDSELYPFLKLVGLEDLPGRFPDGMEQSEDWNRVLSLGEQQRLAAVRAMLKNPRVAFLDEATSALSAPDEDVIYQKLYDMGIAYISVGHRASLSKFHDMVLKIERGGTWCMQTIQEYLDDEDATSDDEKMAPAKADL